RQPAAHDRIETRAEKRIPAAGKWLVLPRHLLPGDERRAVRPEPLELGGQSSGAAFGYESPRGVAGAAPGEEAEDARRSALLFIAFPDRAKRQRRSERARTAGHPPEPLRELQQRSRGA